MKYNFSKEEKVEITKGFENGATLGELAQKFECSCCTIGRLLIKKLGLENYKKEAKKHFRKARQKIWENPTEAMIISCQKNGRKVGKLPRTEKQCKVSQENIKKATEAAAKLPRTEKQRKASQENARKMNEQHAKNHTWISRPEQAFFELLCSKNPNLIIKQTQYLKGLNHPFDIMIPKLKILIEVDGDYTHSRPGRKERDAEINEFVWRTYPDWQLFRYCDEDMKKLGII